MITASGKLLDHPSRNGKAPALPAPCTDHTQHFCRELRGPCSQLPTRPAAWPQLGERLRREWTALGGDGLEDWCQEPGLEPSGRPHPLAAPITQQATAVPQGPQARRGHSPGEGRLQSESAKASRAARSQVRSPRQAALRSPARFLVDGKALQSLGPSQGPWLPVPPTALNWGTVARPVPHRESAAGGVGAGSCLCVPALFLTVRDCFCIAIWVVLVCSFLIFMEYLLGCKVRFTKQGCLRFLRLLKQKTTNSAT